MNKRITKNTSLYSLVLRGVCVLSISFASIASSEELDVQYANTLTYAAAMRTQSASKSNVEPVAPAALTDASGNPVAGAWGMPGTEAFNLNAGMAALIVDGNDGNRNFEKNDLIQNRISILSEMSVNYGDIGGFIRGRAWYDDVYQQNSPAKYQAWSHPQLHNAAFGGDFNGTGIGEFEKDTRDYMASGLELLDAYVYGFFDIGTMPASVKVGRQVINWGEGLAFPNGVSSAINAADANAATTAGVALKEIYLPTESLYTQIGLSDKVAMESFYQWKYRGTQLIGSGTFFSEQDYLGDGARQMNIAGAMPYRKVDKSGEVKDGGEYGIALRYFSDSGAEYAFYAVNAHNKAISAVAYRTNATLVANTDPASMAIAPLVPNSAPGEGYYLIDVKEDIKTYGLSFTSVWGDTQVAGELSHKRNTPIVLDAACVAQTADMGPSMGGLVAVGGCTDHVSGEVSEAKFTQAQMSFIHQYGEGMMWDALTLTGEIMTWQYSDIVGGDEHDDKSLFPTNTANGLGTLLIAQLAYYNVFWSADLTLPISWQRGWHGTNFASNSREDASIYSVGANFAFSGGWEAGILYTAYDGEDKDALDPTYYHLHDRDNLAVNLKYTF